jgi:cell division septation protein DedD
MATTVPDRRSRVVEALGFWFITLVICAVAGLASYRFGRQWIGDRLGGDVKSVLTSDELADRVGPEAFADGDVEDAGKVPEEPPKEAIVEVQRTEVSTRDKQRLRLERQRSEEKGAGDSKPSEDEKREEKPDTSDSDGAEADRAREEAAIPRAERKAAPEPQPTADRPAREHVVRAGSFTKSDNAQSLVKELRAKGYQPFVTETVVDGVTYRRVNVARYEERDGALELREELRADGYPAEVSSE